MKVISDIVQYETLFRQHYRFLCVVAFRVVKDHAAAEDIVHDFFLHCWQKREELSIQTSFQAYATRAVKNLSISYIRRQQKQELADNYAHTDHQSDHREEQELLLTKENMSTKVMEVVDQLPEERKKIFLSYVIEGLSYQQIADRRQVSVNTVKTQMKRAYAFLRENLSEDALGLILLSIFFT